MRRRLGVGVLICTTIAAAVVSAPAGAATAAAPTGGAHAVFERLSEAQRIGQLFMVGSPATGTVDAVRTAITTYHVGNVILTGRSSQGSAATAAIVAGLQGRAGPGATGAVPLFVATDQEGGEVQVLSGPGFSSMPSGLSQGTIAPAQLRADAATWGAQLRSAGVNLNLAPVLDTVPSGANNPPIGGFDREYGHTPDTVASHGTAFAQGMADAGIAATVKHFPGLGRVSENTDTHSGVTDTVTTANDPYLVPFRTAIEAGAPLVMMSTAYYQRIDPGVPAAFSSTIVTGILRNDWGFRGLVISDDVGNAAQVAAYSPAQRAVDVIAAGGDIVLTVNPAQIPEMVSAVTAKAADDSAFRAQVDAAALRVLLGKQRQGLLPRPAAADFDGDGHSDFAVYRPSAHEWFVRGAHTVHWGEDGDVPTAADYTGDGRTDPTVFRPSAGTFWILGRPVVHWGQRGDIPAAGDYTGDGVADTTVFRPSSGTWWIRGQSVVHWGQSGDRPVPGDYLGTGFDQTAIFRPATGTWWVRGQHSVQWGQQGDIPVPGNYLGGRTDELVVYRPSQGRWYIHGSHPVSWGEPGDVPIAGHDFDGDGVDDIAVWRPSNGRWYVLHSTSPVWGVRGDVPV